MALSARTPDDDSRAEADAALVAGVRRGDPASLEAMFGAYATPLRVFAYRMLSDRAQAHEIVQDVFLGVWAQRERWVVHGTLSTYLFGAVKNRALNVLRRAGVQRRLENSVESGNELEWLNTPVASAEVELQNRELGAAIRRAIDALPTRARTAFRLAREQGLTYAQIAKQLGVSVPTVERDMAKAVDALRRELADWKG